MKLNLLSVLAIVGLVSTIVQTDRAEARNHSRGYRYTATYAQFDYGFHQQYAYTERECRSVYTRNWTSQTCFESVYVQPATVVYIEELQVGNYKRVNVYLDRDYSQRYVTYNVVSERSYRRVVRREFAHDTYLGRVYEDNHWHTHSHAFVQLDMNKAWNKIAVGAGLTAIGIDALANSRRDSGKVAGGIAALLGFILIGNGAEQAQEESELLRQMRAAPLN